VTTAAVAAPVRPRPQDNPWLIAMVIVLSTFMEVLDTSIANVSLPHIAGNLSATIDESTWVLTSYLVSNAIVLPLSGWFSNMFGRKRFYMVCVLLFTVSSVLCGLAPTLPLLIFFRILQGLGGGGLQPSTQAILVDTFPPEKRAMGFAVYAMAVVLAPAIGPTLGGWITDNMNWRWIFYINLPVGLASLVLTQRLIHDPPYLVEKVKQLKGKIRIDYIGIGLLSLGLGALQVILDKGQEDDWFGSSFIVWMMIICIASLAITVYRELTVDQPIIDLTLFKERNFSIATLLIFGLGFALFGSTVLIPEFLQTLMGYTATQSGEVLSPSGVVVFLMLPLTGMLSNKVRPRWLISIGLLISGLSLWFTANIDLAVDFRTVTIYRMLQGLGLSFMFTPISITCFSRIPPEKNNAASSLFNLARNLGASFGIATVTTFLARKTQVHHSLLAAHVTNSSPQYQSLLSGLTARFTAAGASAVRATHQAQAIIEGMVTQQAGAMAFLDTFRFVSLCCFALIPFCFLIKKVNLSKGGPRHVE
jgi:DHA2 family multidrug resistance protein